MKNDSDKVLDISLNISEYFYILINNIGYQECFHRKVEIT